MTTPPSMVNGIYRNLPLPGVRLFAGLFSPARREDWSRKVTDDGVVRVTVGADGSLVELVLAEPRQPVAMSELATRIMGCVSRARARIPDLIAHAMTETVGHDEGTDVVLADARNRFPPAPPEPTAGGHEVVEEMRM
jgi:hypothetical protein